MGHSRTPKYRVVLEGYQSPACWFVKENGRPTQENLAKYMQAYNRSLLPGGVNHRLTEIGVKPATWGRIETNGFCGGTVCQVRLSGVSPKAVALVSR